MGEKVLLEFERAWQLGDVPALEDYISDPIDPGLLEELIHIDLDYRLRRKEHVRVEDYTSRFPQLTVNADAVARLAMAEFRLRQHLGDTVDPVDLLQRFPMSADALEKLTEAEQAKQKVVPNSSIDSTLPADRKRQAVKEQIGPYKLLQLIGEGGMGSVYMAEQEQPIRRRVALKVIKPGMDSREILQRFDAEKQALAMMDHSNIAKVLDAGMTDSGQPYFAMELVRGIPITQYCNQHRVSLSERLALFIQACEAIQHAHQKGIVHRDIKPSNVLVTVREDQATVKVIDFGLAKALQSDTRLTDGTLFTGIGQILGTFQYMSPEQAGANALDVDTRTDVYSLGVLLYELLAGSTPIERERLRKLALDVVLRTIREEEPPRPSLRLSASGDSASSISEQLRMGLPELSRSLRGDLDWIVMKAIDKDRIRRYETPSAFAADIQRFLNNDIVTARPPSITYKFTKALKRHRAAFVISAAFVLILIAATGISIAFAFHAERMATRAEAAEETARNELQLKEARERELSRALDWGFAVFESQFSGTDDPLRAVMRRRASGTPQSMSEDHIQARSAVIEAAQLFFQLTNGQTQSIPEKIRQLNAAEKHLSRAVKLDPSLGLAYLARAELWSQAREFVHGDRLQEMALDAMAPQESSTTNDWMAAARLMPESSLVFSGRGYWIRRSSIEDAVKDWEHALFLDPQNDIALHGLGNYYFHHEQWTEALLYYLRAFSGSSSVAALLHPAGHQFNNAKIEALNASLKFANRTSDRRERFRALAVLWISSEGVPEISKELRHRVWRETVQAINNENQIAEMAEILAGMADLPDTVSFHLTRSTLLGVCHIFLGRPISSGEFEIVQRLAVGEDCHISEQEFEALHQRCLQLNEKKDHARISKEFDLLSQAAFGTP